MSYPPFGFPPGGSHPPPSNASAGGFNRPPAGVLPTPPYGMAMGMGMPPSAMHMGGMSNMGMAMGMGMGMPPTMPMSMPMGMGMPMGMPMGMGMGMPPGPLMPNGARIPMMPLGQQLYRPRPPKPHWKELARRSTKVFVGNVSTHVSDELITSVLSQCGTVVSWKRMPGADGSFFGFCEFDSPEGTLVALKLLAKRPLYGKELHLTVDESTRNFLDQYENSKRIHEEALRQAAERQKAKAREESAETHALAAAAATAAAAASAAAEEEEGAGDAPSSADGSAKKDAAPVEVNAEDVAAAEAELIDEQQAETKVVKLTDEQRAENILQIIMQAYEKHPPPPPPLPPSSAAAHDGLLLSKAGEAGSVGRESSEPNGATDKDRERDRDRDRDRDRERDRDRDRDREHNRDRDRDRERERERDSESSRKSSHSSSSALSSAKRRQESIKLAEAERFYEDRLKKWESRERDKLRTYQRDKEREQERAKELEANKKLNLEKYAAYDDDKDDDKYYGKLSRLTRNREKEMEEDEKDRVQEQLEREKEQARKQQEEEMERQRQQQQRVEAEKRAAEKALADEEARRSESASQSDAERKKPRLDSPDLSTILKMSRNELYQHPVAWARVNAELLDALRIYSNKKIVEYIGEEEPALVDVIVANISRHCAPGDIRKEVEVILEDEADKFTGDIWRFLLAEICRRHS